MTDSTLRIVRAHGDKQIPALRILFANFPVEEHELRVRDTLAAIERGTLSLEHFWLAERDGSHVGAALVMHQADGVSLVWPPVVLSEHDAESIRQGLMAEVCQELDRLPAKFGQCLLTPEEAESAAWLADFGFTCNAELFFLARSLETPYLAGDSPADLSIEIFDDEANAARFATLIEHTYHDSLDCPQLNGTRTGVEALAGHRLSGEFHPRGWRLYRTGGCDAGVLLLNEHPDQDAVELTYFGIAPEFRGRGLGSKLLSDAITLSRSWNRAVLFLAVDARNDFANRLYAQAGFQEVARRIVWLRFRDGLSGE